ncbi:MAG TPA: hypothetical protein VH988_04620 [Thermoanaerobaculia bacterium]|jgi:hypothetical protein|nr:hypothetical protein [Thermoanaerobaculia bacterium]
MRDEALLSAPFRTMVQHEAEQAHRRLTWLGSFQGFLFAALAFAWGKSSSLTSVIAYLGLVVALLISVGIIATVLATIRIRERWLAHRPDGYRGPEIFGFFPERVKITLFTSPEMLLPIAFAVAWLCTLAIKA